MERFPTGLARNVKIYPWYQAAGAFLPWLPIFFLFFYQYISLAQALRVSALYYLFVFLLEIPSGYLSDRYGRRRILLVAALSALLAYCIFLLADGFLMLVVGQFFLAAFFAFKSGSDNSILYDSLIRLGREDDYGEHEARAEKFSLISMAVAALAGGLVGFYSLHMVYVLALVGAVVSFYLCWQLVEPQRDRTAGPFIAQLKTCGSYLEHPLMMWLFVFFVLEYSLAHVPAEFAQPYIRLLSENGSELLGSSPLISGAVVALSMTLGAWGATLSMPLMRRYGVRKLLVLALALQCLIIAMMSMLLHPFILLFVMFRNFPMALTHAPLLHAIAPHIDSSHRATYLSMQSLAGRLGFSLILLVLSLQTGFDDTGLSGVSGQDNEGPLTWPQLAWLLRLALSLGILGFLALLLTRWKGGVGEDN